MEIKGDFFVLLHSESQDSFTVEKMSDMVMKNMNVFIKGAKVDYIVIAMADTLEDIEEHKRRLIELRIETLKKQVMKH
ncbi:hypothetical protein [Rahnella sp. PAMC 25559]|uniref:hypothetical protein n=1 Tax=Rahnella sp. PAMC 25559 TaxID=3423225 RepID=UPI003D669C77